MVEFNPEWYQLFVQNTNEKNVLVAEISDLLGGKPHNSCLEIGLGLSPHFAERLAPKFQRYLIVEKRLADVPLPEGAELINADWESYDPKEKSDIIIASHVIYYFQDKPRTIGKMFDTLNDKGRIYFVVNGKDADYGPIKKAFAQMIGTEYKFTYDELISILSGKSIREYTVPSEIRFATPEDLFDTLRITFDNYPKEYEANRDKILAYIGDNIVGRRFRIEQKIIEVNK